MSMSICFPQKYNPVKTPALGMGYNVHVFLYIPRVLRKAGYLSEPRFFLQDQILSLVFQMKSLGVCREIQRSPYFMSMIAEVLISGLLTIITFTESINKLSNVLPCTVYLSMKNIYISSGCFVRV